MCKDNKIVDTTASDLKKIPPLISSGYFKLITANRAVNFRKDLIKFLNKFYPVQPLSYSSWKNRYNNPEKYIPEQNFDNVIQIMEEGLAFDLYNVQESKEIEMREDMELLEEIKKALIIYNEK